MDPFGLTEEVMAPSRYVDKALACDLVIITTPYSPLDFHDAIFDKGASTTQDTLRQLHRRISLLLHMEQALLAQIASAQHSGESLPFHVILQLHSV